MDEESEIIRKMKPGNATVLRELKEVVEKEKKDETERRIYSWFEDAVNINFWEYRNINPTIVKWFEICEDICDWDDLAAKLGLLYKEIQHCRKLHCGYPTREVFNMLEEKKNKDLSLRKVLDCLVELGQHDILSNVPWQKGIEKFKNEFHNSKSMYKEGCKPCELEHSKYAPASFSQTVQQRQEIMVKASHEGLVDDNKCSMNGVKDCIGKTPRIIRDATPRVTLDAKIMLVFAGDARVEALKVADQLRNPQTTRGRVGVLMLGENGTSIVACQLREDSYNSIHKWFKQVDFVVPMLSPQFLRQIQNQDWENNSADEKRYNCFVYRLTLDHYVDKGCKNYKCRPLCPSVYYNEVIRSELVRGNGLLQMHWNSTEVNMVEELAEILISEAKERRKRRQSSFFGITNSVQ